MTHNRETCRLCGRRTRRLFFHVYYAHLGAAPTTGTYADHVTATMRAARGES